MRIMTNINVNNNEISNAVLTNISMKPLASAPANPKEGEFYYDTTKKKAFQFDGEEWKPLGGAEIEGATGEVITVTVDTSKDPIQVTAVINEGSIGKELLDENVQASLDKADSAIQEADLGSAAKENVATEISETAEGLATAKQVAAVKAEVEKTASDDLKAHVNSTETLHVTADEKTAWNNKVDTETYNGHVNNNDIHFSATERENLANVVSASNEHIANGDIHVTTEDKARWNDKYTKEETNTAIAEAIAGADHLKREIVTELPTENIDANTIYMIKKGSSENGDNYEEYMYINEELVKVGDSTVDLTDYLTKTGDASDTTVTFTEADEKTELASGDKLSVLFGKIKKWFSSLHAVAFSGSYNDLTDKPKTTYINKSTMTAGLTTYSVTIAGEVTSIILTEGSEIIIGDVTSNYNEGANETTVNVTFATASENDVEVKIAYIA